MSIEWKPNLRIDIDPDARKDYTFDFSEWLSVYESDSVRSITSHTIIAPSTVTIDQSTHEGEEVTFWISDVPDNETVTVTVRVELDTDPAFSDDFSIRFRGRHK
jgi:hypothetical protein